MDISYAKLRDKILGCWNGKNVGGVLGGPYEECPRMVHDVHFYAQDINGNPPGNDDLDLQLVWLHAAEQYGKRLDARVLADYWMSYIYPNWSEYGMGKRNLRAGMQPPLCGYVSNPYKDSNGSWIRTEIWACMAPGHPEIAVRYAYEDAIIDHAEEGVYATAFCAAVESAAFVVSDKRELIQIGLSYIPENCLTAQAIRLVEACYDAGKDWKQTRFELFTQFPGTFGVGFTRQTDLPKDLPAGTPGMDAPNNLGIIVLGLLYGEDDFEKSLCITVNCGEDTDCTAATVGAIFGIIHGNDALPEKWLKPLDGVINTCCIDLSTTIEIPANVQELTDRVIKCIPVFVDRDDFTFENGGVAVRFAKDMYCAPEYVYIPHIAGHKKSHRLPVKTLVGLSPFCVRYEFGSVGAILDYCGEPFLSVGETRVVKLTLWDANDHTVPGQWANVKLYADDGVQLPNGCYLSAPLLTTYQTKTEFEIPVTLEAITGPSINILLDITVPGRATSGTAKLTFYPGKYRHV